MNDNDYDKAADEAVEAAEAYNDMVEATRDRKIFAEMEGSRCGQQKMNGECHQPLVQDFTEIVENEDFFILCAKIDDGRSIPIGFYPNLEGAKAAQNLVCQIMGEYYTKRNDWNWNNEH